MRCSSGPLFPRLSWVSEIHFLDCYPPRHITCWQREQKKPDSFPNFKNRREMQEGLSFLAFPQSSQKHFIWSTVSVEGQMKSTCLYFFIFCFFCCKGRLDSLTVNMFGLCGMGFCNFYLSHGDWYLSRVHSHLRYWTCRMVTFRPYLIKSSQSGNLCRTKSYSFGLSALA